jgi:hypothetical protein
MASIECITKIILKIYSQEGELKGKYNTLENMEIC